MRLLVILAAALLFLGTSRAETSEGELACRSIELPEGARIEGAPLALFSADTSTLTELSLVASWAVIHVFEETYVEASLMGQRPGVLISESPSSWQASELDLKIDSGNHAGWLGLTPQGGIIQETTSTRSELTARSGAKVGNGELIPDEGVPAKAYYLYSTQDAVWITEPSSWTFEGPGVLKIFGPDVILQSETNTTRYETGETRSGDAAGTTTIRWLVIDFNNGTLQSTGSLSQSVHKTGVLEWAGASTLKAARGELRTGVQVFFSNDEDQRVEGQLRATIYVDDTREPPGLWLALTGDITSTSMLKRTTPVSGSPASWWIVPLLLVGLAIGASGALFATKRHPREAPLQVEDYVHLAELAADDERYDDSLTWMRRARAMSPTSRRLIVDEACITALAGRKTEALQMLKSSPTARESPEGAFLIAQIAWESSDVDEAAFWLSRALDAAPVLLLDIENDPDLTPLLVDARLKPAIRKARQRLDTDDDCYAGA